jgi:hypothetical protein
MRIAGDWHMAASASDPTHTLLINMCCIIESFSSLKSADSIPLDYED